MEAVVVAKIVSLFIVLVISVVFGNAAYFVLKRRQTPNGLRRRAVIISVFNAFSGGVFLGTCLLHLMEEGREELEVAFAHYQLDIGYPVFECIVAGGFFAIVFVDFVAQLCFHESSIIVLEDKKPRPSISTINQGGQTNPGFLNSDVTNSENLQIYGSVGQQHKRAPGTLENNNDTLYPHIPGTDDVILSADVPTLGQVPFTETTIHQADHHHQHEDHGHAYDHNFDVLAKASTVRAVLLLTALSFHTVFDGLAIGLQEFDTDVWQVLAAISVHKALVAFCLGLQLYQAYRQRTRTAVILVHLFCLMSPIGIGLGIIATTANIDAGVQTMTSAILQGIASGTFLYVTFFEILIDAFSHGRSIWNIVVAAIGFGAMAAVKLMDTD